MEEWSKEDYDFIAQAVKPKFNIYPLICIGIGVILLLNLKKIR